MQGRLLQSHRGDFHVFIVSDVVPRGPATKGVGSVPASGKC